MTGCSQHIVNCYWEFAALSIIQKVIGEGDLLASLLHFFVILSSNNNNSQISKVP